MCINGIAFLVQYLNQLWISDLEVHIKINYIQMSILLRFVPQQWLVMNGTQYLGDAHESLCINEEMVIDFNL